MKTAAVIAKATPKVAPPVQGVVQPKLAMNVPGDRYEQEADAMADWVLRQGQRPSGRLAGAPVPPLSGLGAGSGGIDVPASVARALANRPSAGAMLPERTRRFMEEAFSTDFAQVRIHADGEAAQMAQSIGARAFTHGADIYFDQHQFAPDQPAGQRLLAHELTHVVQQQGSAGNQFVQREGNQPAPPGVSFQFSVRIQAQLTPDQLLLEFIKQHHHIATDAEAETARQAHNWHWIGTLPDVTPADVRRGYKLITVRDTSLTPATGEEQRDRRAYFGSLSAQDQAGINAATDQQFWQNTQYRPGQQLGRSATDRLMAPYWMTLRDELIRQRQAIDNLPQEIRQMLFGETGPPLQPADYQAMLRIADKLMLMSQQERQDYLARTNARTADLATFEASIDRYRQGLTERREATLARENAKTALVGLDAVYGQYRLYKSMVSSSASLSAFAMAGNPRAGGAAMGSQPTINRLRDELTANLQRHGYASIDAFEVAIRAFETAFQAETVLIARAMLERYDHILWTQEQRYQDAAVSADLHQRLGSARTHFGEASRIRDEHAMGMVMTPDEMADQAYWSGQYQEQMAQGRAQVRSLSGELPMPVTSNEAAESVGATGSATDLQRMMLDYVRARRTDVAQTRQNLDTKPALVWDLDTLVQRAKIEQDIRPGSIYDRIIQNHIRDEAIERAIIGLGIAVFAIAAGLVSMGSGTVAVLGATAAFGVSAYQAVEDYRRYEMQSAAHGAQLLSDDPSFAWVIVSLVGAGIDLGGIAMALRPAVRGALQTFNQTGNVAELELELARLARVGEINEAISRNLLRAASARAEANVAWDAARARYYGRTLAVIDPLVTPLLNLAINFAYPVYLSMRNGIISLERFLLTREAISLLGDMHHLNPEQMAAVRQAYALASTNVEQIAARGSQLHLTESEIGHLLGTWNQHPTWTIDDVLREMDTLYNQGTRVFVTGADPANATSGTIHVIRDGQEATFARTNRTLQQNIGRGFLTEERNLRSLRLSVEEMQGKRVLDVAAGTEGFTAQALREQGIEAFGIDIAMSAQPQRVGAAATPANTFLAQADLAAGVPFSGQFDIIYELYGGIAYGLARTHPQAVTNLLGRLRSGGTLYLAPLDPQAQRALTALIDTSQFTIRREAFHGEDQLWRIIKR